MENGIEDLPKSHVHYGGIFRHNSVNFRIWRKKNAPWRVFYLLNLRFRIRECLKFPDSMWPSSTGTDGHFFFHREEKQSKGTCAALCVSAWKNVASFSPHIVFTFTDKSESFSNPHLSSVLIPTWKMVFWYVSYLFWTVWQIILRLSANVFNNY